jgi:hypothetical protein
VIVAVSVTGVPWVTGEAGDVVSAVLVAFALSGAVITAPFGAIITKGTEGDVEGPNAAGSEGTNIAVSECDPMANLEVNADAVPFRTMFLLRLVLPSLNCTMPVAVAGVTVAVNATGLPWWSGDAGRAPAKSTKDGLRAA